MTPCPDGADCVAFQRLSDRGDRLEDRCHVRMFDHPARDRFAKLPEDYTPFVYRSEFRGARKVPERGLSDDEQLARLIEEVERNGYGDDLITADGDSLLTGSAPMGLFDENLTARVVIAQSLIGS